MHKCTLCAKIQIREGVKKTRIFKDDKMLGKLAEKRRSRSYFFLLLGMGVCGVKMFNFGALGKTLKTFFLCASSLAPSHFPDTSSNVLLLLLESLGRKIFTSLVIMFFLLQYF